MAQAPITAIPVDAALDPDLRAAVPAVTNKSSPRDMIASALQEAKALAGSLTGLPLPPGASPSSAGVGATPKQPMSESEWLASYRARHPRTTPAPQARVQPAAAPKDTNYEMESVSQGASDTWQALKAGTREGFARPFFELAGWIGDQFGADLETVKGIADMLGEHAKEDISKMSSTGRDAMQKGSLTDGYALFLKIAQAAPSVLGTLAPTTIAANVGARGLQGAAAVAKAATYAGRTGAVTEGAQMAGAMAGNLRETFATAPDAEVRKMAQAAEIAGADTRPVAELREELQTNVLTRVAPALTGVAGVITGYAGGKLLGKVVGKGSRYFRGMPARGAIEAGQEAPQSGMESAVRQYTTGRDVDVGQVGSEALEGGVVGFALGAAMPGGGPTEDTLDRQTGGAATGEQAAALNANPPAAAAVNADQIRAQAADEARRRAEEAHAARQAAQAAAAQGPAAPAKPAIAEPTDAEIISAMAAAEPAAPAQAPADTEGMPLATFLPKGQVVPREAPPAGMKRVKTQAGVFTVLESEVEFVRDSINNGAKPDAVLAALNGNAPAQATAQGSQPVAEPRVDIAAQVADAQSPQTPARAVYLAPDNVADDLQFTRQQFYGTPLHEVKDATGGILLTSDQQIADEYRAAGATKEARARALAYAEPKPAAGVAVERVEPATGGVAQGQVVSPENVPAVVAQQQAVADAAGQEVVVSTPEAAVQARTERRAREHLPLRQLDVARGMLAEALQPPKDKKGRTRLHSSKDALKAALGNAVAILHGYDAKSSAGAVLDSLVNRGLLTEAQHKALLQSAALRRSPSLYSAGKVKGDGGKAGGFRTRSQLADDAKQVLAAIEDVLSTVTDEAFAAAGTKVTEAAAQPAKPAKPATPRTARSTTPAPAPVAAAPTGDLFNITYERDKLVAKGAPAETESRTIVDLQFIGEQNGLRVYDKSGERFYVAGDNTVSKDTKRGVTTVGRNAKVANTPNTAATRRRLKQRLKKDAERQAAAAEVGSAGVKARASVGQEGELTVVSDPLKHKDQLLNVIGWIPGQTDAENEALLNELLPGVSKFGLALSVASRFMPLPMEGAEGAAGVDTTATVANKQARERIQAGRTPEQAAYYERMLDAANDWPTDPSESATTAAVLRGMAKAFPGGAWPNAVINEWVNLYKKLAAKRAARIAAEEQDQADSVTAAAKREGKTVAQYLRDRTRVEEIAEETGGTDVSDEALAESGLTVVEEAAAAQEVDAKQLQEKIKYLKSLRGGDKMTAAQLEETARMLLEQEEETAEVESEGEWTDEFGEFEGRDNAPPTTTEELKPHVNDVIGAALLQRSAALGLNLTADKYLTALYELGVFAGENPAAKLLMRRLKALNIQTLVRTGSTPVPEHKGGSFSTLSRLEKGLFSADGRNRFKLIPFNETTALLQSEGVPPHLAQMEVAERKHGVIVITLPPKGIFAGLHRYMLHEIVHAVTVGRYWTDTAFADQVDRLFDLTMRSLSETEKMLYGMLNPREFLAEAFTNRMFQRVLARTPVPKNLRSSLRASNLWHAFVQLVKRKLGLSAISNSVLDEVLLLGDKFEANDVHFTRDVDLGAYEDRLRRNKIQMQAFRDRVRGNRDVARALEFTEHKDAMPGMVPPTPPGVPPSTPAQAAANFDEAMYAEAKRGNKHGLMFMMFDHLERHGKDLLRNVPGGEAFTEYMKAVRAKIHAARQMQGEGEVIARELEAFNKANPAEANALFKTRHDATLYEVDPTQRFTSDSNAHLRVAPAAGKAVYDMVRAQYDALSEAGKQFYQRIEDFYIKQMNMKRAAALSILAKNNNVRNVEHFLQSIMGTHIGTGVPQLKGVATLTPYLQRQMAPQNAKPADLEMVKARAERLAEAVENIMNSTSVKGSYSPLTRSGDLVVEGSKEGSFSIDIPNTVTDKDTIASMYEAAVEADRLMNPGRVYERVRSASGDVVSVRYTDRVVSFFHNMADAKQGARKLRAEGYDAKHPTTRIETFERNVEGMSNLLATMERKDASERDKNLVKEAVIEMLVEHNVRKSDLQRKRVAGAEHSYAEGVRALARQAYSGSWAIADLTYMLAEQENLGKLMDVQTNSALPNATKIGDFVNELRIRRDMDVNDRKMDGWRRLQSGASRLAFVYYLGSLSYAMTNATQLFMVGLPHLVGRHGIKAVGVMTKNVAKFSKIAFKQIGKGAVDLAQLKPHHMDEFLTEVIQSTTNNGQETHLSRALDEMRLRNVADSSQIFELGRIASGRWMPTNSAGRAIAPAVRGLRGVLDYIESAAKLLPQITEIMNRVVLAATAFELEGGLAPTATTAQQDAAIDYAFDAINRTQGDYSDFNRARILKMIPGHRLVALYKTYGWLMYTFMLENFQHAITPVPADLNVQDRAYYRQRRKEAGTALATFFALNTTALGAVGGLMLEPLRAVAMFAAQAAKLFADDDDEEWIQMLEKPVEQLRKHAQDEHGAFMGRLISDGLLSATGANWTDRIGMHHLLWMPQPDARDTVGAMQNFLNGLGGPVWGLALKGGKAMDAATEGNWYRSLELMLPKGVSDVMKAGRLAAGGRGVEDARGIPLFTPEAASFADVVWQVVGFAPQSLTQMYEEKGLQEGRESELYREREILRARWLRAGPEEQQRIYSEEIMPYRRKVRGDAKLDLSYGTLRRAQANDRKKAREHARGRYAETRAGQKAGRERD